MAGTHPTPPRATADRPVTHAPAGAGPGPDPVEPTEAVVRATGVLMALLPCSAETAQDVLVQAARTAGAAVEEVARAAASLRGDGLPVPPPVETALRRQIDRVLAAAPDATAALLPDPYTLRHHLARFRDLRRRTFAAPHDVSLQARLGDAGRTLCVLLGRCAFHRALEAAEQLVAVHRLPASPHPAGPGL